MRTVRGRKKHCLQVITRAVIAAAFLSAGAVMGILLVNRQNSRTADNRRVHIVMLSKNVEAGQLLKADDVKEVSIVRENDEIPSTYRNDVVGKRTRTGMKKGIILNASMLCVDNEESRGIRKLPYTFVRNTDALKTGDYIDIRISFPNGADFVLLAKKEVIRIESYENEEEKRLWLGLNEEEILRMSSGVVDAYLFEGAYIYADLYINPMQETAIVNYPVNEVVEELLKKDPNIVKIAQDQKTFDLRNRIYDGSAYKKKEGDKIQKESLAYFD